MRQPSAATIAEPQLRVSAIAREAATIVARAAHARRTSVRGVEENDVVAKKTREMLLQSPRRQLARPSATAISARPTQTEFRRRFSRSPAPREQPDGRRGEHVGDGARGGIRHRLELSSCSYTTRDTGALPLFLQVARAGRAGVLGVQRPWDRQVVNRGASHVGRPEPFSSIGSTLCR